MDSDGLDKLSRNKRIGIPERQPDPTKTSVIGAERDGGVQFDHIHTDDNSLPYRNKETRVFKDSSGRSYFEISKFGADQMFLAKMLKGIMPVSDVIYQNAKFLSYKMPLNAVAKDAGEMNWQQRVRAYNLALDSIFGDHHHYRTNIAVSGDTAVMYDFHLFGQQFWYESSHIENYVRNLALGNDDLKNNSIRILYLRTLLKVRNMLDGETGSAFLREIVDHIKKISSQTPTTIQQAPGSDQDERIKSFRDEVLRRIDLFARMVDEYNAK